jgi:hypothetical protein
LRHKKAGKNQNQVAEWLGGEIPLCSKLVLIRAFIEDNLPICPAQICLEQICIDPKGVQAG